MRRMDIEEFFRRRDHIPVVDVRSPGEFQKGHVPGAHNIPLFDDDQRARVGIAYHHAGRQEAVMEGLRIAGPRMEKLAEQAREKAGSQRELILHCWRGGMRSESMAWLFDKLGITNHVLQGGYKQYRRYGREQLKNPAPLIILGGYTGSGKTDILQALADQGEQVLDLEGLAHHKGSAFGAMGQQEQPAGEQFENLVFEQWMRLDLNRPVWIEDESKMIGKNGIPDELFHSMRAAPVFKLEMSKQLRVERLVKEYTGFDKQQIRENIQKISKRLGGLKTQKAMEAVDHEDFYTAVELTLDYYDKAYLHGLSKREPAKIYPFPVYLDDPAHTARLLIQRSAGQPEGLNVKKLDG